MNSTLQHTDIQFFFFFSNASRQAAPHGRVGSIADSSSGIIPEVTLIEVDISQGLLDLFYIEGEALGGGVSTSLQEWLDPISAALQVSSDSKSRCSL